MKQNDKFKGLEFAQVLKGGAQILFIPGNELTDQTKYGLQVYIGDKLGDGLFSVRYKDKGDDKTKHMNCRSIITKKQDGKTPAAAYTGIEFLVNRFEALEKTMSGLGKKLDDKTEENYKLRLEILEGKQNKGIDLTEVITNIGAMLLKKRLGVGNPAGIPLQENGNNSEIPGEVPEYILNILQKIDWAKVDQSTVNILFNQFKDKIPFKG